MNFEHFKTYKKSYISKTFWIQKNKEYIDYTYQKYIKDLNISYDNWVDYCFHFSS